MLKKLRKALNNHINTERALRGDPVAAVKIDDEELYKVVVQTFVETWPIILQMGTSKTRPDETTQKISNHYFQIAFHLCSLDSVNNPQAKDLLKKIEYLGAPPLEYEKANHVALYVSSLIKPFPSLPWTLNNGQIYERHSWMVFLRLSDTLQEHDPQKMHLARIGFHLCSIGVIKERESAWIDLGAIYSHGLGVEPDNQKAIGLLLPLGDTSSIASLELAYLYSKSQDFKSAADYFKKSILIGKLESGRDYIHLAKLYIYGLGVSQDTQKAIDLLNTVKDKLPKGKKLAEALLALIDGNKMNYHFESSTLSTLGQFILLDKAMLSQTQYADAVKKQNELLGKLQQFNQNASSSSASSSIILNQAMQFSDETSALLSYGNGTKLYHTYTKYN